jgi:RNA polymerase subunit RPABC4/transcription elongation factor Spt4
MPLSEEAFTALVDAGCPACQSKRLAIEALVAQWLPLLAGEPFGTPSWGYKGEDLVRGTYRIACDGCKKEIFTASACPRCGAADGIRRALEEENAFPLPKSCASCRGEQLTATAFVPALVVYEGRRASKARARVGPEDPGFHVARVECKSCHAVTEPRSGCPLCTA